MNFDRSRNAALAAAGVAIVVLAGAALARDRGVNQPGAVGNPRADPGFNQPGAVGNVGVGAPGVGVRDPGINQPGVAGNVGGVARRSVRL